MGTPYSFVSRWEAPASRARCWDELLCTLRAGGGSWWRALSVPDPPPAVVPDEQLTLQVRSPWGYRLRVRLTFTEIEEGVLLAAASEGDLRGHGRVELAPMGPQRTEIVFRWDVSTERPWMNAAALVLRPAFVRAHHAVMRAGERGMQRALQRDRAVHPLRNPEMLSITGSGRRRRSPLGSLERSPRSSSRTEIR